MSVYRRRVVIFFGGTITPLVTPEIYFESIAMRFTKVPTHMGRSGKSQRGRAILYNKRSENRNFSELCVCEQKNRYLTVMEILLFYF